MKDLTHKIAQFFSGEDYAEYGEDAELKLTPSELRKILNLMTENARLRLKLDKAITDGTDLRIILNRLKLRMKDRDEDNGGEPLNAVDRGYHLAYEHLCEEIDNLLKENE